MSSRKMAHCWVRCAGQQIASWVRRGRRAFSFGGNGCGGELKWLVLSSMRISLGIFFAVCFPILSCASGLIDLTAPAGWTSVPKTLLVGKPGITAVWFAPADQASPFRQNINIAHGPTTGSLAKDITINVRELKTLDSSIVIWAYRRNRQCRPGASEIITYSHQRNGLSLVTEQVLTIAGDSLFVATYTREVNEPESPAATSAIEAMCASKA
jgi:hypothetical protein